MTQSAIKKKYYRYWGKSEVATETSDSCHLLIYHGLDVAAVCSELLSNKPGLTADLQIFSLMDQDALVKWLSFLTSIHDIGKFADGFQNLCPTLMRRLQGRECQTPYVKHDSLGYRFCEEHLMPSLHKSGKLGEENFDDIWDLLSPWIMAVTGHHGQPPSGELFPQPLQYQFPDSVIKDCHLYLQDVFNLFLPGSLPFDLKNYDLLEPALTQSSWLCAGISVIADWIGSNQNWFPHLNQAKSLLNYWQEDALPQARAAIKECGLLSAPVSKKTGMKTLFPALMEFNELTPLQRLAQMTDISPGPQMFLVEEVTGGGKTEAAITLAHRLMAEGKANGFYMALPTMATANAMHQRVRNMYKNMYTEDAKPSLILAHSAKQLAWELEHKDIGYGQGEQSASEECAIWLSDSRKKALLAHVGVGTIDQALLAILPVRHQSLRVYGLTDKVLIIDEVHACDAYVHRLLCTLLRFHASFGGNVILLSASLPQAMRDQLINAFAQGVGLQTTPLNNDASYPLLTHFSSQGLNEQKVEARKEVSRRVEVQPLHSENAVEKSIQAALEDGSCICWVRNTVQDARDAYQNWARKIGTEKAVLFHARFTLFDRLNIENAVMRQFGPESQPDKRKGMLLIATQVVEQSLDLDFDYMISDLAPIDLIIQRAGRLQRHQRPERSRPATVLGVFMPMIDDNPSANWYKAMFPKAAYVYPHHGQLWLTAKWLSLKQGFSMPDDARDMIESVYGDAAQIEIPDELQEIENEAEGKDKGEAAMGVHNSLNIETGYRVTLTNWQPDEYTPTRLGDPTVLVRLAKWQDGELRPLHFTNYRYDWELSQISVRQYLLAADAPAQEAALTTVRESMPDGGRYCVIVPLEKNSGQWRGAALDLRGNEVVVKYDETGLTIEGSTNESH